MKPILFPRTGDVTVNSVHYWCKCNLHHGFNVRQDRRVCADHNGKTVRRDHIAIETNSVVDYVYAKLRWVG
jgi:hypothetical protein